MNLTHFFPPAYPQINSELPKEISGSKRIRASPVRAQPPAIRPAHRLSPERRQSLCAELNQEA